MIALGMPLILIFFPNPLITPKDTLMLRYWVGTNDEALEVSADDFVNTMRAFVTRLLGFSTDNNYVQHICFIVSLAPFVCRIFTKLITYLVNSLLSRTTLTR